MVVMRISKMFRRICNKVRYVNTHQHILNVTLVTISNIKFVPSIMCVIKVI
jgi:hypothetical protein